MVTPENNQLISPEEATNYFEHHQLHKRWNKPEQTDENTTETALVDYLLIQALDRLSDRTGDRHAPPWEPNQEVRIGVLPPNYIQDDDENYECTGEDDSGNDVNEEDYSSFGIDFQTTQVNSDESITVKVDVDFAIYQPEWPTYEEMYNHIFGDENGSDGDTEDDDSSGRNVSIPFAWRRINISVEDIQLEVPLNGETIEVSRHIHDALEEAIRTHFSRPEAARPFEGSQMAVPESALESESTWRQALSERSNSNWIPEVPEISVFAFADELPNGNIQISVSLANQTEIKGNIHQDLSAYDSRIAVTPNSEINVLSQSLSLTPQDYRYRDQDPVPGIGRKCIAVETEEGKIKSQHLPLHIQPAYEPRTEHVPQLDWDDLSEDPLPILRQIESQMREYLNEWDEFLEDIDEENDDIYQVSSEERNKFEKEIDRFANGIRWLNNDEKIYEAFCGTNRIFSNLHSDKDFNSWRLFQLVYIVTQLPTALVREHPENENLKSELDHADVLWFPTGGGKTEAYLGLITVVMLYDRMRGKNRGASAWLRFPLRMLSIQQLGRVMRLLVKAEQYRQEELDATGEEFKLGYLVGGSNTPNSLYFDNKWWPGMENLDELEDEQLREHRYFSACPYCGDPDSVTLKPDKNEVRLKHECTECEESLPVYITDDEVYRYQPTVVVSTVDKITGFAHYGEFTSFIWGPKYYCPDHGYCSVSLNDGTPCQAWKDCDRSEEEMEKVTDWYDPVPALIVQDELHLVREELGTFSAHMEGLLAALQSDGPSGLPSKMLAATATIEQYENHLSQVYGRHPRRFPSPGFKKSLSFYVKETDDIRRAFLGIMPTGTGRYSTVDASGALQSCLINTVQKLQNKPEILQEFLEETINKNVDSENIQELLFKYEVSLSYVNSKVHGDQINDDLAELSRELENQGEDKLRSTLLTGDVPLSKLAEAIDLIEEASLSDPRSERLRALVGTSVISHGVDLNRLNLMFMTGLPPRIADYIQATSRSGRQNVGLVCTLFDSYDRREASTFSHFHTTHQFLDRMVEPVPINKYARNAVRRTLPTILTAILWHLWRDPDLPNWNTGIRYTREFSSWWDDHASKLVPKLEDLLEASYRSHVEDANNQQLEDQIAQEALERWSTKEQGALESYRDDRLKQLFSQKVMSSLRDIDEQVDFSPNSESRQVYEALFGYRP